MEIIDVAAGTKVNLGPAGLQSFKGVPIGSFDFGGGVYGLLIAATHHDLQRPLPSLVMIDAQICGVAWASPPRTREQPTEITSKHYETTQAISDCI